MVPWHPGKPVGCRGAGGYSDALEAPLGHSRLPRRLAGSIHIHNGLDLPCIAMRSTVQVSLRRHDSPEVGAEYSRPSCAPAAAAEDHPRLPL